jgi:hypothetical protein
VLRARGTRDIVTSSTQMSGIWCIISLSSLRCMQVVGWKAEGLLARVFLVYWRAHNFIVFDEFGHCRLAACIPKTTLLLSSWYCGMLGVLGIVIAPLATRFLRGNYSTLEDSLSALLSLLHIISSTNSQRSLIPLLSHLRTHCTSAHSIRPPLPVTLLRSGCHFHLRLPTRVRLRHIRWNEIDRETPKVKGEYKGDDPFHNRSCIMFIVVSKNPKGDCETDFNNYEKEFDPERGSYYTILAMVDSKTLIFPADAYR